MSKKHHYKLYSTIWHDYKLYSTLILGSVVTRCISISAFASLIGIPIGIASSVIGLKFAKSLLELIGISQ